MSCSQCAAATSVFSRRVAASGRRRYEKRGPDSTTRRILAAIRRLGVPGGSLLDIGGGIGVLGCELFADGIERVTLVDGSRAHIEEAASLYDARGRKDRLESLEGDFVALDVSPADLVTLDRVVCCYPDQEALLGKAGRSARRMLAMSMPRDVWFMRAAIGTINLWLRLRRNDFRVFVHPHAALRATLEEAGMQRVSREEGFAWVVEAYAPAGR